MKRSSAAANRPRIREMGRPRRPADATVSAVTLPREEIGGWKKSKRRWGGGKDFSKIDRKMIATRKPERRSYFVAEGQVEVISKINSVRRAANFNDGDDGWSREATRSPIRNRESLQFRMAVSADSCTERARYACLRRFLAIPRR